MLPQAWGEFLAGLADWDWFVTITFRDELASDKARIEIAIYLALLERAAGPIGWLMAEEFGSVGGRFHCHLLVTGVRNAHRQFWWAEAFRRFGRTRIEPFDPNRAAAFYAAKYAAKSLGNLELGGTLQGIDLDLRQTPRVHKGGEDVALSAELPKQFYRLGLKRRPERKRSRPQSWES
jgi:hypothetical protein